MNWKKLRRISAIFYIAIYVSAMIFPRKVPKDQLDATNFLKKLFQDLLYLSGDLEVLGNIFLLMPIFAIIVTILGKNKSGLTLAICILLATTAEFLQRFIPGRVSSTRDVLLNSSGALIAFLDNSILFKNPVQEKNSKQ